MLIPLMFACNFLIGQTIDKDYYDGKMYFKFKDNSDKVIENLDALKNHSDISIVLNKYGITKLERPFKVLKTPTFDRTYRIEFQNYMEIENMIKELEQLSYMEYAEMIPIMRSDLETNDPEQNSQYAMDLINAKQAWDLHQGGNATVAIVDDAVFIDHLDLGPNVWTNPGEIAFNSIDDDGNGYTDDINGWDAADNDSDPNPPASQTANGDFTHGTHCAGIASAATNNNIGVASIGFNTKIIPVKGKSDSHTGSGLPDIWDAFVYGVASGADVISCSWGGGGFTSTEQNIITTAYNNGQIIVAAAGNDGEEALHFPAAYDNVIAVANTTQTDTKNNSSNYGEWVDISAPGSSIYSTLAFSNDSYGDLTGTSMSCPMVAGLLALLKSANPFLSNAELEECIKSTAVDINNQNPTFFGLLGAGRIDAFAAMQCASPDSAPILQITTTSSSNNTICPGDEISFIDNSAYSPTAWSWTFPGGIPATSNEQNPSVYYPNTGVYDVTFSATNDFGTNEQTFSAYVNVDGAFTSYAFYEDFEGEGLSDWTIVNPSGGAEWEITPVNSGGVKYGLYALSINNFDNNSWGSRDAAISPPINLYGRSTATLEIDYAYRRHITGDSDSLIISASIDGGVTFPIVLLAAADDGEYSLATYVILNGGFAPNGNIDWCGEGAVGADCLSFDISEYSTASDFRVKIENFSKEGNNFYIDNVRVLGDCISTSVPPLADFNAENRAGCNNLVAQFSDASVGVASSWSWSFPGGTPTTSTERNPQVTYSSVGTYEVSLIATNGAGANTATKSNYIIVNDQEPIADFDVVTAWAFASFNNMSQDGVEYLWDFGDGTTSTEANPTHNYWNIGGDYTITLTVTNGCGTDVSTQNIQTTSIENPFGENTSFSIYPNPNSGQFTIEVKGKDRGTANIVVYDVLGRIIHQSTYELNSQDWKQQVNIKGQAIGTYIVKIEIDGLSTYEKIVIR